MNTCPNCGSVVKLEYLGSKRCEKCKTKVKCPLPEYIEKLNKNVIDVMPNGDAIYNLLSLLFGKENLFVIRTGYMRKIPMKIKSIFMMYPCSKEYSLGFRLPHLNNLEITFVNGSINTIGGNSLLNFSHLYLIARASLYGTNIPFTIQIVKEEELKTHTLSDIAKQLNKERCMFECRKKIWAPHGEAVGKFSASKLYEAYNPCTVRPHVLGKRM